MSKDSCLAQPALQLPGTSIASIEAEAIGFLRENCDDNVGLAFSGGKDSVVIYEIMVRSGIPFSAIYNSTQIDPPEVVRFIRKNYPRVNFLYPKRKFWDAIQTSCPPMRMARWCCSLLKHGRNESRIFNTLVLGIRKEESYRRSLYPRVSIVKGQPNLYPIFHWTEADVWEYIEYRNLPYCSLYDEGFDRLGCVPCPYRPYRLHMIGKKRWPGIYKAFENSVKKWFYSKQAKGATMNNDTPEEFLEDWYHGKASWYKRQN